MQIWEARKIIGWRPKRSELSKIRFLAREGVGRFTYSLVFMTIQEILRDLKVDFLESGHHHCRSGWVQLRVCPFCSSDNYHLGFNLQNKFFVCWRCRWHLASKVLEALGMPPERARAVFHSISPDSSEKTPQRASRAQEPREIGPLAPAHIRYLKDRELNPKELTEVWGVKGIGLATRLKWRIYIPITYEGRVVSWTTRAIGNRVAQRYISASAAEEEINHKELLFGGDYVSHSVVVCEGPFDAMKIGPGAVAVFGTAFSSAQVRRLARIPRRFICFDSSKEAQKDARELANQLSCFPGITENILISAKDPGSASDKEIRQIRRICRL